MNMYGDSKSVTLTIKRIPDPQGHNKALLLRGDWLVVGISDGCYTGYGEASLSGDDDECEKTVRRLFDSYVKDCDRSSAWNTILTNLSAGPFSSAGSFVEATAISGINQALYELSAKREGKSVGEYFKDVTIGSLGGVMQSHRAGAAPAGAAGATPSKIPVYATINRALTTRTPENYRETVKRAVDQGFAAVKCAPFEQVEPGADQREQRDQARYGLKVLKHLRSEFPELSIRIDFHERFCLDAFTGIVREVEEIVPFWLEAPLPIGSDYAQLKPFIHTPIALGELYFGVPGFDTIVNNQWADIIMPDVVHVGGFGPLAEVIRFFSGRAELSLHNASGPIASAASLHAAALSPAVTSIEIPLIIDERRAYYLDWLDDGVMRIPEGEGWGGELRL